MAKEIYIALRNDALDGDGTVGNPFDGGTDLKLDGILFNNIKTPVNTTLRFGPGVFRTKGMGGLQSNAVLRSGQRWIGSGMYSTTLELVKAAPATGSPTPQPAIAVIGGKGVSDIE